jgi:tRNA(Arg) A34 adenosine deaminase TadA
MMTPEQFRDENTKAWTVSLFDAIRNRTPVAYTFGADGTCYYAVKESGAGNPTFDPVWTLFGLGDLKKTDVFVANKTALTASEDGIMAVPGRFQKVRVVWPKDKGYRRVDKSASCIQVRIDVADALGKEFPVPGGSPPLVSDIRSVTATVKDDKGAYAVSGTHTVHRLYMMAAFTILRKMSTDKRDGVVALVVDKEGRIISWGRKNPKVSCWHGETSAIMRLNGKIPAGCCVFSTLKPCHMCSSLIYQASGGTVQVYWGEDDPGAAAQGTMLDEHRVGAALDGNKPGGLAPYPITMNVKGPPGAIGPRDTMANTLKNSFNASGERSTIDHITTSPEAADFIKEIEVGLKNKINKYASGGGKNENTKRVVEYLVNFLKLLKLNPDDLGK